MGKAELEYLRDRYKNNLRKFITASAVCFGSTFGFLFNVYFFAILMAISESMDETLAFLAVVPMILSYVGIFVAAVGTEAFIPGIVVFGIKLGKVNRKLDRLNEEVEII